MSAPQLIANVCVDGIYYGPDYVQPPADVAERITNPAAWGDEPQPESTGDDDHQVPPPFTRDDMTVAELRAAVAGHGITGMSRAPRDELLKVLAEQDALTPSAPEGDESPLPDED